MHGGEFLVSWVITRDIFFSTDFSYVKGRQDADPARNIPATDLAEIPPVRSRTSLRYETGRLMAEIEAVFAGAQRNVNTLLGEQHTAGYGTANLKAGMNLKGMVFRIGLNNLFDRAYHEHLSYQRDPFRSGARVFEPGRNVHVNLSYRF
jgi:iron complex outermembrane receptor protein